MMISCLFLSSTEPPKSQPRIGILDKNGIPELDLLVSSRMSPPITIVWPSCTRDAVNSELLIKFMTRLTRDAGRKVFLILDNLRVHHSKNAKKWLEEH